jgi:Glycosyltransferase family 92
MVVKGTAAAAPKLVRCPIDRLKPIVIPSAGTRPTMKGLVRVFTVFVIALYGIADSIWFSQSLDMAIFVARDEQAAVGGPKSWEHNQDIPLHAGLDNSVSSCLMFMDDNHRLVEWLAYHYFVMPLRHVVVLPDPRSRTSPMDVLERWTPYMTIEVWNDTYNIETSNRLDGHYDLVARQQRFYSDCGLYLRSRNRTWTTFVDVDEFWAMDDKLVPDSESRMQQQGAILTLIDELRKLNEPNTTLYKTNNITLYQGTS